MAATDGGSGLSAHLAALAAPIVSGEGAELVDTEVKGPPGNRMIRLVVDADGGIDVELCATLSRRVGAAFDEADAVPGRYTLQVTSPGIDRPLRGERDFARNVGRAVRLVVSDPEPHGPRARELVGAVVAVDAGTVTLDVDGEHVPVPLSDVDHGRVVLPW